MDSSWPLIELLIDLGSLLVVFFVFIPQGFAMYQRWRAPKNFSLLSLSFMFAYGALLFLASSHISLLRLSLQGIAQIGSELGKTIFNLAAVLIPFYILAPIAYRV